MDGFRRASGKTKKAANEARPRSSPTTFSCSAAAAALRAAAVVVAATAAVPVAVATGAVAVAVAAVTAEVAAATAEAEAAAAVEATLRLPMISRLRAMISAATTFRFDRAEEK